MKTIIALFVICLAFSSCRQSPAQPDLKDSTAAASAEVKTGGTRLIQVDGKYNVWTKKIGDGKIKVLLLHGGPGFTHDYMECFEDFLPKEGIEFYYYDQLGCGNSDQPSDTSLWRIPRFVEEVEQVRKGLGLENFYLLGHSWGGMLAMEYLAKYQSHVKGAVLSNMTAGIASYMVYAQELKQKFFTAADRKTYDSLDQLKKYDSPEFQNLLMNKLYSQVICRLNPWPEPVMRAFKKANMAIYIQMQGVDEFHVTGNFKNWDVWDRLKNINVPTLVLGGVHDEMNPADMKREAALLPNSRLYLCPNGSHMAMYDDQQNYFRELTNFLKEVDGGGFKADKKQ
jgi:proline iminopeptidase